MHVGIYMRINLYVCMYVCMINVPLGMVNLVDVDIAWVFSDTVFKHLHHRITVGDETRLRCQDHLILSNSISNSIARLEVDLSIDCGAHGVVKLGR